ncbi:HDOD domain-containing protein [Rhodoferax sp.]|uniref:HDOD domain-containing protein n=1 Tax=Rhodoferax sp. TaxID=50421 RepID=UPI00284E65B2|nr:HDOD domain-containing protein [Rhodoferax sp.]MDR3370760.1 HDOD domain-containing protein [Rhodoferax sp.]
MLLKRLIDQPGQLPTIPKVGRQLIATFASEDVSVGQVAAQLAADPVMCARLLRLANSAYFHVPRTVETIDAALQIMGMVMARNLVIGASVAAAFKNMKGIDLPQFWRYNLYTACAARWLADRTDVDSDMVFTLGVLHAIGQLQMQAVIPEELVALNKQMGVLDEGRAKAELELFGFHYGDVSAELARAWNFPLSLVDALRHVADPLAVPNFSEAAAWVHMGSWCARAQVLGYSDQRQRDCYPYELGRRLYLEPHWAPALADRRRQDVPMPPLPELTNGLEAMFE